MTKRSHRRPALQPSPLTTTDLAAVCGGAIDHVELKRGHVDPAPHDQGIKVYVDVVYNHTA